MHKKLMPSQELAMEWYLSYDNVYYRRSNGLMLGSAQIGKSYLAERLPEEDDKFLYVNFTKEYLEDFIQSKHIYDISFQDFQVFLRETFEDLSEKTIILDEIDSLISLLIQGDKVNLPILYKQFIELDQATNYIFISSIYDKDLLKRLKLSYHSRVNEQKFTSKDKNHIIAEEFKHLNVFDLSKIKNLRQMLVKK